MRRAFGSGGGVALLFAASCGGEVATPEVESEEPLPEFRGWFEDVTAESGLAWRHATGGFGEKRLPETMGSGAAFLDYDGDGALDVFLVGFAGWEDGPESARGGTCALFRGRGDGTFVDVSEAAGADVRVNGMGASAADFDADGDVDLFVTTLDADLLLVNEGGRFVDRASAAGVSGAPDPGWTTASLWLDADADGDLDLFVGGYVVWSVETEIFTSFDGIHKVFTTPDHYPGRPSRLYLNRGDGTFEPAPFEGDEPSLGKVLGAVAADLDGDGLPEILAANDTRPNFLFKNLGEGRFEEIGMEAGLAYDEDGRARAGMGIDVAQLDGARTVVAIGNFTEEPLSLYERGDACRFEPIAASSGLRGPTYEPLAFGVKFLDADLDGWLDLLVVNGHIEPDIANYESNGRHAQRPLLLRGAPSGVFVDVSDEAGPDFARPMVARGLAHGDVDGDGDVDLLVTENGGAVRLFANRVIERARPSFLRVRLRGTAANPEGIGSVVQLRAAGRLQLRGVGTGGSYLSQGERVVTFGLGEHAPEGLTVRWPDGRRTEHTLGPDERRVVVDGPP